MNAARAAHLLALLLLPCVLGCDEEIDVAPLSPRAGTVHVLDTGGPEGDTGWWPSVAVDSNDRPHISYCDAWRGDLKYATRIDKKWQTESVIETGAVGKYTTIAIAPDGGLGIAFYDQDTKYLRYAFRPADEAVPGTDGWASERIAWGLEVGMAAELLFDASGRAHLFYYVPSGKLVHATRRSGAEAGATWSKRVLAEVTGSWTVRIDPVLTAQGLWLSYVHWNFKDTTLFLAHSTQADPLSEVIAEPIADRHGPGWRSQVLVNGSPPPRLLYTEAARSTLRLARRKGNEWSTARLLDDVGNFAAATHGQQIVVAYEDVTGAAPGKGLVRLLRFDGNAWRRFTLDAEGPSGEHMDMALDSKGRAIVAYYARDIRGLKVFEEADAP